VPVAAWEIANGKPGRLTPGAIELEKTLEGWIAADPELIEAGLAVIGQQVHVEGGYLDLLCVDLQGRAAVVEIKRGKLIRDVIAQAIDYASSIAAMSAEELREKVDASSNHPGVGALLAGDEDERDVAIIVVGVGAEPGLERIIVFLGSKFGMEIRAVTFDVFALGDGRTVLVREEQDEPVVTTPAKWTRDQVIERAGGPTSPNGRRMLLLADAAERNGLYVRPRKYSLMFAPQEKKYRHLMTVWKWANKDELALQYSADALAEFFPIRPETARAVFAAADAVQHAVVSDDEAQRWADGLDALFAGVANEAINGAG
jgi:Endonuclease NucS